MKVFVFQGSYFFFQLRLYMHARGIFEGMSICRSIDVCLYLYMQIYILGCRLKMYAYIREVSAHTLALLILIQLHASIHLGCTGVFTYTFSARLC